jgi:hypothetical protein
MAGNKRGYHCKCGGKLTPKNLVDIVNKESEIEKLKRQIAQLQANQNHV